MAEIGEIERVADTACVTGENPTWHPDERVVYWTDIPGAKIYRYDPASGETTVHYSGDIVAGFTVQTDGALLLFGAGGKISLLKDGNLTVLLQNIPAETSTRFNDIIADPMGRVLAGTMPTSARSGRLYRVETDLSLKEVVTGIGISNGLGFSPDRRTLYYTDSDPARTIYQFDFDAANSELSNQRTFTKVNDGDSVPDGLTVDAEGNIWSARWDGGCVVKYAPDGRELSRLHVPGATKVSSLTFGGDDYEDIYLTTAGGDDKGTNGAYAGSLFRVRLGVKGVPEFRSKISVP